ncbi:hypothetical protein D3C71_1703330 [compost metagenome]
MRPLLAQHLLGANDAGAVHQPVQTAKGTDSRVDGSRGSLLVADVGHCEAGIVTQLTRLGFDRLGIEVDQHDLGTSLDQHLRGGGTQARSGAADDEMFIGYLHDRCPFRRRRESPARAVVWRFPDCAG